MDARQRFGECDGGFKPRLSFGRLGNFDHDSRRQQLFLYGRRRRDESGAHQNLFDGVSHRLRCFRVEFHDDDSEHDDDESLRGRYVSGRLVDDSAVDSQLCFGQRDGSVKSKLSLRWLGNSHDDRVRKFLRLDGNSSGDRTGSHARFPHE